MTRLRIVAGVTILAALLGVLGYFAARPTAGKLARQADSLRIVYHADTAAYSADTLATDSVLSKPGLTDYVIPKSAIRRERRGATKAIKTGEHRVANLEQQLRAARPRSWIYARASYVITGRPALEAGLGIRAAGGRLQLGAQVAPHRRARLKVEYQREFRLF